MSGLKDALGGIGPGMLLLKGIFDAVAPVIDIVTGLFGAFAGAMTAEIIPALKPLFDILLSFLPIFKDLGALAGELIALILKPILAILASFMPIIMPLLDLALIPLRIALGVLEPIIELLLPYIDDFALIMEDLAPIIENVSGMIDFLVTGAIAGFTIILENLGPIFEAIGEVVMMLIRGALSGLVIALFWVGETIFAIIDALTVGEVPGRGDFRDFFADLFRVLDIDLPGFLEGRGDVGVVGEFTPGEPEYTPGAGGLPPGYQSGTDYVPRTGQYTLHQGEEVKPEAYTGESEMLLRELISITKKQTNERNRADFFSRRR